MNLKQITIDKDAFIGIDLDVLCSFAKNHFLILPEVLIYECMTSDEMKKRRLLERCKTVIDSGAYYCPRSMTYAKWEAQNSSPYSWFIADLKRTNLMRKKNSVRKEYTFDPNELRQVYDLHYEIAKGILSDTSDRLRKRMASERPDIVKEVKKMPQDKTSRLVKWFEIADKISLHNIAVSKVPAKFIKDGSKFCLSEKWISWQYFRLIRVLVDDYYYYSETGGSPQGEKIEHDFQDMEYVLLLSRTDALITRDSNLVIPLAKAAFPDKDIFSDLNRVPKDYVCHWS
jgi:hypothetical protein